MPDVGAAEKDVFTMSCSECSSDATINVLAFCLSLFEAMTASRKALSSVPLFFAQASASNLVWNVADSRTPPTYNCERQVFPV